MIPFLFTFLETGFEGLALTIVQCSHTLFLHMSIKNFLTYYEVVYSVNKLTSSKTLSWLPDGLHTEDAYEFCK